MNSKIILSILLATLFTGQLEAQDPLFPNSVVSNDIDFIFDTDPDAFVSLEFLGIEDNVEMPSSISEELFDNGTFMFEATFSNDKKVGIRCHSSFLTQEAAQVYAEKLCPRLGKLPFLQRDLLNYVVIHNGDATAFAEETVNFFVLYSENMDARISTHDLEETVFHESVHASFQTDYEDGAAWLDAQMNDPTFVTEYGQNVLREDMAETALFAYTYFVSPGRLSSDIETWLETNIPNRMAFFEELYGSLSTVGIEPLAIVPAVYPNPSNDVFNIVLPPDATVAIDVYSPSGEQLFSDELAVDQKQIDLSSLPTGVYLVKLTGFAPVRVFKY